MLLHLEFGNGYTNSWRKLTGWLTGSVCHLFGLSAAHHKICLFFSAIANSAHFSRFSIPFYQLQLRNFLLFLSIAKSRDPVTAPPEAPLSRSCVRFFRSRSRQVNFLILHLILLPFLLPAACCLGNSSAFSTCFLFWQSETFQRSPFLPFPLPASRFSCVCCAAFCIFGRYEGRKFNLKVVIVNAPRAGSCCCLFPLSATSQKIFN